MSNKQTEAYNEFMEEQKFENKSGIMKLFKDDVKEYQDKCRIYLDEYKQETN